MVKKKSSRRRFRFSTFYMVYWIMTAVLILIIVALLAIVKDRLAEYEAVQPKYLAAEVFARYFDPVD